MSNIVNKEKYRSKRSELIELAENANRKNITIHFNHLDELIAVHSPSGCNHHMMNCVRHKDYIFELCFQMKGIESSTRYNDFHINIGVMIE